MEGSYKMIFMIFTFIFSLFFLASPSQCLQWYSSGLGGYAAGNSPYHPNYSYFPYFSLGNSDSRLYLTY
ncbi:MAG: hypothetical protein ACMUHX_03465, partial [bacterium]